MKLDSDSLQKHLFWLLLGVVIPVVLVALGFLLFSVAGKINDKKEAVTKAKTDLETVSKGTPKNQRWLTAYEGEKQKWTGKRDEVHQKAWQAQSDLMTWPTKLQPIYQDKYFGDPIDPNDRTEYADSLYKTQFAELYWLPVPFNKANKKEVNVQYKGGPDGFWMFLQPVQWTSGDIPSSENIWLAQENLWVRRELLRVVRQANELVGVFQEVNDDEATEPAKPAAGDKVAGKDKTAPAADKVSAKVKAPAASKAAAKAKPAAADELDHKRFRNHYWELDLVMARNANGERVLRGKLTNIAKRQLALGTTFIVRVQPRADGRTAWVHVDGEPLPAGKSTLIKELPIDQASPEGIFGVEQAYNWRTVPVKRIEMLAMSYPSHRNATRQLMPPNFPSLKPKEGEEALTDPMLGDAGAGMMGGGMMGGGMGPGGMGPGGMPGATDAPGGMMPGMMGGMGMRGGEGMMGGGMMGGGMMGGGMGMGMDMGPLRLHRYIDVTGQVRRLPVALVVIVDQAHIQDFLTAFANSRLRIQTTQVHWQRCYESMKPYGYEFGTEGGVVGPGGMGPGGVGPGAMGPGGMGPGGMGRMGGMMGRGGDADAPGAPMMGRMPGGGMGPAGMGGGMPAVGERGGPMARMGGVGGMMPGGAYRGMNFGGMPGDTDYSGMPGYGMTGMSGYPQEGEIETFNLVELTVYGIASLYERYPPKPPEPEKPAEGEPPAESK